MLLRGLIFVFPIILTIQAKFFPHLQIENWGSEKFRTLPG